MTPSTLWLQTRQHKQLKCSKQDYNCKRGIQIRSDRERARARERKKEREREIRGVQGARVVTGWYVCVVVHAKPSEHSHMCFDINARFNEDHSNLWLVLCDDRLIASACSSLESLCARLRLVCRMVHGER